MSRVLLIDEEPNTLLTITTTLRKASHLVFMASSSTEGLKLFGQYAVDIILTSLRLGDPSGLHVIRTVRDQNPVLPVVIITGLDSTQDLVAGIRLGATDFIQRSISPELLLETIDDALAPSRHRDQSAVHYDVAGGLSAHAAVRWARAIVGLLNSPDDPRTITTWSHWIAASPGAVRNWCFTAGITPRHSLVFGRMLRAVVQGKGGFHRPENLLDVVDRRTLSGLYKLAGVNGGSRFPQHIDEFLACQTLVRDPDALLELRRALECRPRRDRARQ